MSYFDPYAGNAEKAFNHGPLKIDHWRFGRRDERKDQPETIQLTDVEEIRDLHYMLGRVLAKLDGKS